MFVPSQGQLNYFYAYHADPSKRDELAHAVIALGAPQSLHTYKALLRKTAKQLGVQLQI